MLDAVNLVGVGENSAFLVHDNSVFFPAVPKFAADFHILVRLIVSCVGVSPFGAVIRLLVPIDGRHDVPGSAATCQVIERRPHARRIERMLVAGRKGRAKSDVLRYRRHPADQRDRVVLRRLCGIAECGGERARISVRDVVEVGEEHHVEETAFAGLRDMLVEFWPSPVVRREFGLWMPPHAEAVVARPVG